MGEWLKKPPAASAIAIESKYTAWGHGGRFLERRTNTKEKIKEML